MWPTLRERRVLARRGVTRVTPSTQHLTPRQADAVPLSEELAFRSLEDIGLRRENYIVIEREDRSGATGMAQVSKIRTR